MTKHTIARAAAPCSRRALIGAAAAAAVESALGLQFAEASAQVARPESEAGLWTIAAFPKHYFLENLTVRSDNSLLVTVLNKRELWYLPPARARERVTAVLLHTFSEPAMGILEAEPDVFYICTSNLFTTRECHLHRLDLRGWRIGAPVAPSAMLQFPHPAGALNGCCLLDPSVVLVADSIAGLIWRVDLASGTTQPQARIWLKHESMALLPDNPIPNQPGINSVRYAAGTGQLYYTSTAQMLFMRVRVDPRTLDPVGLPEFVAGGMMGDDFCIDETAGVAYVTTHRQNTIDRVWLDPRKNSVMRYSVAGDPFTEQLIGPSSSAWGRGPNELGRVAFVVTDGGLTAPPPSGVREARVLRVEIPQP